MNKHQDTSMMKFRTIDGTGNNKANPDFNSADSDFTRMGTANFADGISEPTEGPNPRAISNIVVGEGDPNGANAEGLSGMMYAWGQFLDHDLDLSKSDGVNHIDVTIPAGDPNFADGSFIAMTRAIIDSATGAGTGNPATAVNAITGWLDGSQIYGSDAATAASLRSSGGHLKTDGHNNLPTTPDGQQFLAGDIRAQENPSLTALQTLFVREHNYQVDLLHKEHPHWSSDQLYNQARAIVGAELAHITYTEFLPHLLGPDALTPYHGYDKTVDPRITEEFAGAAFRFGHSIVSADTERIDNNGEVTGEELELRDTFFPPPDVFNADGGTDGFLRHLTAEPSQAMDGRIVEDLRNFLFDPPVGMDLAAINIQRGHDLGLPTLNGMREDLGLAAYTSFDQITDDAATVAALEQAFASVDEVDLWTGGLSEAPHTNGGMLGETFATIIANQFEALRDGDRFWYQNQDFDKATLAKIEDSSLSDIIVRNTDTKVMQEDAFVFTERHTSDVEAEEPDAPQLIIGVKGSPVVGGDQDDTLVAAPGHKQQVMTGGEGADHFVFNTKGAKAIITDFNPAEDQIVIDHGGNQHPHVEYDHGDTIIQIAGDTITLDGVKPWQLHGHDWLA